MHCKRMLFRISVVTLTMVLAACASTKITKVWVDEKYAGVALQRVMVLAFSPNEQRRQLIEEAFIEAFQLNGVDAFGSIAFIPLDEDLNVDAILSIAKDQNADAIFTLHFKGVQTKTVPRQPPGVHSEHYTLNRYL